ncbi:MAG TPA: hypothetical protein VEB19_06190 [Gemmatimonadaceae bacterium]|nr:hypothetical protein [Gemmatimonadaceae bacterium]
MALKVGSYSIADLLANKQTTVAEVDEQELAAVLQRELDAHNALTDDMVTPLADLTEDRQRAAGAGENGENVELDEFGRAPTQKTDVGANLGFPLKKFGDAVGWTRDYFEMATLSDFARKAQGIMLRDTRRILTEAKKALYLSSNYSITDRYVAPALSLDVKRLANADSFAIPAGPNGEAFDSSTHSHYTAENGMTAAGVLASVNNVLEHFDNAQTITVINSADEAGVRGLTGFKEFVEPGVQLGTGQVATQRLDSTNLNNRAIGRFGGSIVWVKPWGIDNYLLTYVTSGGQKPLAYRVPTGNRKGLRLMAHIAVHPLHADQFQRMFGFGVQNRVAAAVHYIGGGSYTDPTISL